MADRQPDRSRNQSRLWDRLVDPALQSRVRRKLLSLSFFINLLGLATPVFVLQTYDRVIMHAGISTLQALVAGVVLFGSMTRRHSLLLLWNCLMPSSLP